MRSLWIFFLLLSLYLIRKSVEGCQEPAPVDIKIDEGQKCGNGKQEDGEECDDGNDVATDGCVNCRAARCGDGVIHFGHEICDDGNNVDDDFCSNSCNSVQCGNGVVNSGEECDDGNDVATDSCVNCRNATCGDGAIHVGHEICDDGNNVDDDFCSNSCIPQEHLDMYLYDAAVDNNTEEALHLLSKGATNAFHYRYWPWTGWTALHWSAGRNNMNITMTIVDLPSTDIDVKKGNNATPLIVAAADGRPAIVRFLVERGANVNARDDLGPAIGSSYKKPYRGG